MDKFIFLTDEGYTFQPDSDSEIPDIENLQVIGFSIGLSADDAFAKLLNVQSYLKETSFNNIFCYKLDVHYEETRKDFCLKIRLM